MEEDKLRPISNENQNPVNLGASLSLNNSVAADKETGIDDNKIKPIRTYESDIAEYVKDNKTSATQITLAEQKRRLRGNDRVSRSASDDGQKRKVLIFSIIVILILGGLGALYAVYVYKNPSLPVSQSGNTYSFIVRADSQKEINLDIINKNQFKKIISNERDTASIPLGKILAIYFTTTNSNNLKTVAGVDTFISLFGLTMPPELIRALDQDFMFGIHSFNGNAPFLILKTQSFQNAFSGMLAWENSLADNLSGLFVDKSTLPQNQIWSDRVLFNKDARVLINSSGNIALLYSIIDNNTIIITNNESTLREILSRLTTAQIVR